MAGPTVINLPTLLKPENFWRNQISGVSNWQQRQSEGWGGASTMPRNPFATAGNASMSGGGASRNPFTAGGGVVPTPPLFQQLDNWQTNVSRFAGMQPQDAGQGGQSAPKADPYAKYKQMAQRMGLDWKTTVDVYLNPNRNGQPLTHEGVIKALGNQAADRDWGNLFTQFYGRGPNQQEWDEHWYWANGMSNRDPLLTGNNYAQQAWQQLIDQANAPTNELPPPTY